MFNQQVLFGALLSEDDAERILGDGRYENWKNSIENASWSVLYKRRTVLSLFLIQNSFHNIFNNLLI